MIFSHLSILWLACKKTLLEFEKAFQHTLVSFAYIDFDLYDPTVAALKFLNKHLSVGGIICFDEACMDIFAGEGLALVKCLMMLQLLLLRCTRLHNQFNQLLG